MLGHRTTARTDPAPDPELGTREKLAASATRLIQRVLRARAGDRGVRQIESRFMSSQNILQISYISYIYHISNIKRQKI